jgi:hypothetical protein
MLMQNVDCLFHHNDAPDKIVFKEPIFISKRLNFDMAWQGLKHCLGWDYAAQSKHLLMVKYQ